MRKLASLILTCGILASCSPGPGGTQESTARPAPARNLLIITIDTLRPDRVGCYGYGRARTPAMDGLAARGARFERAYAPAPITLPSHATLLTGRYPPGHGGRHNGMRVNPAVPTLAETLQSAGFATAAFVSAFPLDRRFGLNKGFMTYGDRMPRGVRGRLATERPGSVTADEAIAWLNGHRNERFLLWVHFFEPHSPYGTPGDARPLEARYDDEVAEADRQTGRVLDALGPQTGATLVVLAGDHGEAFGEHGEIGHSIFVYDTTLRVPLLMAGPGLPQRAIDDPVGLVDVAPTVLSLLGVKPHDADGIDLGPALNGSAIPARELYAESFAPLLDFGWSPLRSVRAGGFKYIAAPKPELYDLRADAGESQNLADVQRQRAAELDGRVTRISPATLGTNAAIDPDTAARLQALGYTSGTRGSSTGVHPDPKDRKALISRLAQITAGELTGAALERALTSVLAEDAQNPQAHLRLGYLLLDRNRCSSARSHFQAAIDARLPSADAHLGLAACQAAAREFSKAAATLRAADVIEPGNPVVAANLGIVLSDGGSPAAGIDPLKKALELDPDFHEARFNLAVAFARTGHRAEAAAEADELLRRLPPDAPQRPEIERFLSAVR